MAAPQDRPGDSSSERPTPETSTRRPREQTQIDFELEFLGRVLEREPFFVDALRKERNNSKEPSGVGAEFLEHR